MATILSHRFDKQRLLEIVDLEDMHGRKHQIQAPILDGFNTDAFIQGEIAQFEAQERAITEHIAARFDAITLQRKSDGTDET